jgi:hypothetical protein
MVLFSGVTVKPAILVYELIRVFVLCATRVGRPMVTLPATWYAAAPLLVLPFILKLLCQLEHEHATVYDRLYLITKGLSALGCLIYIIRTLASAFSETNAIDYYAFSESGSFTYFELFFLVDVILLLRAVRRKRRTDRKKRKGGASDASFD